MISGNGIPGLGDLLWESATIAFDSVSGKFINPQDGTVYGTEPPAGGWPISWYKDNGDNTVVLNQPGAPQTTVEAVNASLAAQQASANAQTPNAQQVSQTAGSNATSIISGQGVYDLLNGEYFGGKISGWMLLGASVVGLWVMKGRG